MPAAAPPAHACTVCAALPPDERPRKPRPAPHGGPRSRRCTTHDREYKRAARQRGRVTRRIKTYGLDDDTRERLKAIQNGACPICLRGLDVDQYGRERKSATDHDHACCPQAPTCGECTRGITCAWCNHNLLGSLSRTPSEELAVARRLVAYLADPPMAQLRRQLAETENVEDVA